MRLPVLRCRGTRLYGEYAAWHAVINPDTGKPSRSIKASQAMVAKFAGALGNNMRHARGCPAHSSPPDAALSDGLSCAGLMVVGMENGKKHEKRAVWLAAAVLIAAVLVLLFMTAKGNNHMTSVSSSDVAFTDIQLADDTLTISGSLLNSAQSCRKYSYTVENIILYLTISAGLVNRKYPSGDFTFEIQDAALQNVSFVRLKSSSETTQIYPKCLRCCFAVLSWTPAGGR